MVAVFYYEMHIYLALASICLFFVGFGVGTSPVFWVYLPEILPAAGVTLGVIQNWFLIILTGFIFPYALESFGLSISFGFFLFCVILGYIFLYYFIIETKGKT